MEFNDYQKKSHKKSLNCKIGSNKWLYPFLGVGGEAGEIVDKAKKLLRDKEGKVNKEFVESIKMELGDLLFYMSEICCHLNIKFDEVPNANLKKIAGRWKRNTIKGSGDNR